MKNSEYITTNVAPLWLLRHGDSRLDTIHKVQPVGFVLFEDRFLSISQLLGARQIGFHGVDKPVVFPKLVMEVGAGGETGCTNRSDDLALLDLLTFTNLDSVHVRVARCVWARVIDLDEVSVSTIAS